MKFGDKGGLYKSGGDSITTSLNATFSLMHY